MEQCSIQQIIQFCNGIPSVQFNHKAIVNQLSIDSRQVGSSCIFVAIKGVNQDGHTYVKDVVSASAQNFAIVAHDFPDAYLPNLIRVDDPIIALGLIASNYRKQFNIPIVAITGSNGKTTIKEMLKQVLRIHYGENILATLGNLNNHLGVPLTLLNLSHHHQVAVIEMGMNHTGEIDYLTQMARPTIAVVNNVLLSHAGNFANISDIARAKGEIYHGLSDDGIACVNMSSPFAQRWQSDDIQAGQIFGFGTKDSGCFIEKLDDTWCIYQTPSGQIKVTLNVLGVHNYLNALTVIALALNLGCGITEIKAGLENYSGYPHRLERKTAFNGAMLIDDSYNANPDSVKAALAVLKDFDRPKWFIFGDLKELGTQEQILHARLAEDIQNAQVDMLITVGQLAKITADNFSGNKVHCTNNNEVVNYCLGNLPSNVVVLIKASKSMCLFDVASQLT